MRQTNKKVSRSKKKQETQEVEPIKIENSQPNNGPLPINQSTKKFININEYDSELAKKNRRLLIIVVILSTILLVGWLIILKINVQQQSYDLGFDSLKNEINASLAKFDTQIADSKKNNSLVTTDVLQIKKDLEEQIKNNPDSTLWDNYELTKIGLSVKYPSNWQIVDEQVGAYTISDKSPSTTDFGQLTIASLNNSGSLTLEKWLEKNEDLQGYESENLIFRSATSTQDYVIYTNQKTETNQLNKLYYFVSGKKIVRVKLESVGLSDFYLPLTQAIIQTIKIN